MSSRGWIDQRQDAESGLTYLHARYYDPALGIVISPDKSHPLDLGELTLPGYPMSGDGDAEAP
jgi:RHS repeat-associated protein